MRRIALDTETLVLLKEHKQRCRERLAALGIELTDEMYVFSGIRNFDPDQAVLAACRLQPLRDMAERFDREVMATGGRESPPIGEPQQYGHETVRGDGPVITGTTG
jgi:hypothetical protein